MKIKINQKNSAKDVCELKGKIVQSTYLPRVCYYFRAYDFVHIENRVRRSRASVYHHTEDFLHMTVRLECLEY